MGLEPESEPESEELFGLVGSLYIVGALASEVMMAEADPTRDSVALDPSSASLALSAG